MFSSPAPSPTTVPVSVTTSSRKKFLIEIQSPNRYNVDLINGVFVDDKGDILIYQLPRQNTLDMDEYNPEIRLIKSYKVSTLEPNQLHYLDYLVQLYLNDPLILKTDLRGRDENGVDGVSRYFVYDKLSSTTDPNSNFNQFSLSSYETDSPAVVPKLIQFLAKIEDLTNNLTIVDTRLGQRF